MKKNYKILKEIFNRIDPINVSEEIDDEYAPEIDLILKDLKKCKTQNDIKILVFKVIARMLGDEIAIRNDNYLKIAEEIIKRQDDLSE